ncbi:MAG: hypothetical protein LBP55_04530 [Candidatus Adiutrix sp.]|nr:hypothetical protein [Candidatus Adiutrix sp.]
MKKSVKILISLLAAGFLLLAATAMAAGTEPVDLDDLSRAGLSKESLSRYLAQNLGARQAPPISADLLARLGRYGGDGLVLAYLDLDRATASQASREFSPEVVAQLMAGGTPPRELQNILAQEAARAAGRPLAVSAGDPPVAETPALPSQAAAALPAPPRAPEAVKRGFQELRPGQEADPATRLPLPYSTYDIRQNNEAGQVRRREPGPWLGVEERELPDGHLVEANSVGDTGQVGQEVYRRPSGHQFYRYYTGNPDTPRSGADPAQEWKNREDLEIIYGGR